MNSPEMEGLRRLLDTDDAELGARLAGLGAPAPSDFVARVLAMTITDRYVVVDSVLGELCVAFGDSGITHVAVDNVYHDYPSRYLEYCGRVVRQVDRKPAGLVTAVRTGRSRKLEFDLSGLPEFTRAALVATMNIPRGEVRSHAWIAREIDQPGAGAEVASALLRNPCPVLIPCHRVVAGDADPGDHVLGAAAKSLLLEHEGVNLSDLRRFAAAGVRFVGSDTTRIFCHPSCKQARRITEPHRVLFTAAAGADQAGYRPCRWCRPVLATSA